MLVDLCCAMTIAEAIEFLMPGKESGLAHIRTALVESRKSEATTK